MTATRILVLLVMTFSCEKELTRADLKIEHKERVPSHGVYAALSGLGASGPIEYWVTVDTDGASVTQPTTDDAVSESRVTKTRPLQRAEADALRAELDRMHGIPAPPDNQGCTDVSDLIVIADGDTVVVARSSCPLNNSSFGKLRQLVWSMTTWPRGSQP